MFNALIAVFMLVCLVDNYKKRNKAHMAISAGLFLANVFFAIKAVHL